MKIDLLRSAAILLAALLVTGLAQADKPLSDNEWFMKTSVSMQHPETGNVENAANWLTMGRMNVSSDGKDQHDIGSYGSLAGARISAAFIQTDWGNLSGQYITDYRSTSEFRGVWPFSVFSSLPGAEVTIQWDGVTSITTSTADGRLSWEINGNDLKDKRLKSLSLVDVETFEEVNAVGKDGLNNYTFIMGEEGVRNFAWVLGPLEPRYFENSDELKAAAKDAKLNAKEVNKAAKDSLKDLLPPTVE